MNVHHTRTQTAGLLLFGLLSLGDLVTILVTDGDSPPYAIAAMDTVLGAASLSLIVRAFRDRAANLRLLVGLRVVSAITAVPAFFVDDVPTAAKAAAGVIIVLTGLGVLLVGTRRTSVVTA